MSLNDKSNVDRLGYQPGDDKDSSLSVHNIQDSSRSVHTPQDSSRSVHHVEDSSRSVHSIQDSSRNIHNDNGFVIPALSINKAGWNNIAVEQGNGIKAATNADFGVDMGTVDVSKQIASQAIANETVTMDNALDLNAYYVLTSFMVYAQGADAFKMDELRDTIPIFIPYYANTENGCYIPKIPIPITIKKTDNVSVLSHTTIPIIYNNPNATADNHFSNLAYKLNTAYLGSTGSTTSIIAFSGNNELTPDKEEFIITKKFHGKNKNAQIASFGLNATSFPSGAGNVFVVCNYRLRLQNTWHDYKSVSYFDNTGTLASSTTDKIAANAVWSASLNAATATILATGTAFAIVNIWNPAGWVVAIVTAATAILTYIGAAFGINWDDVFGWPKADYSGINGIDISSIEVYDEGRDPDNDNPDYKYNVEHRGKYKYYYDKGWWYDGHWRNYDFGWTKSSTKRGTSSNAGLGLKEVQFRISLAKDEEIYTGTNSFLGSMGITFALNDTIEEITFTAQSDLSIGYEPIRCNVEEDPEPTEEDNFQLSSYLLDGSTKYLSRSTTVDCIYVDTTQFASSKGFSINMKLYPVQASGLDETSPIVDGEVLSYIAVADSIGAGYEASPTIPTNNNITCRITTPISDSSIRTVNPDVRRLAYLFDDIYLIIAYSVSSDVPYVLGLEINGEYILPDNLLDATELLDEFLRFDQKLQLNNISIISSNRNSIQLILDVVNDTNNISYYMYMKYTKVSNYDSSIYIKDKRQKEQYILTLYSLNPEEVEENRALEYLAFPNDDDYRKRNISIYVSDANLIYKEPLEYSVLMSHGGLSWFASKRFLGESFARLEDITSFAIGGKMIPYKLPYLHIPVIYPNFKSDNTTITGADDEAKLLATLTQVTKHMGYDYDILPYNKPEPCSIGWINLPSVSSETRGYDSLPEKLVDYLSIDNLDMINYIAHNILTIGREQYCVVNKTLHKKSTAFSLMAQNTVPVVKERGEFFAVANLLVASTDNYSAVYASNNFELKFLYTIPVKTIANPIMINGKAVLIGANGIYVLDMNDSTLIYKFDEDAIKASIRTLGSDSFILVTETLGDVYLYSPGNVQLIGVDIIDVPLVATDKFHSMYKISNQLSISQIEYTNYDRVYLSDFSDNTGDNLYVVINDAAGEYYMSDSDYDTYSIESRYIKINSISLEDPTIESILLHGNASSPSDLTIAIHHGSSTETVTAEFASGENRLLVPINLDVKDIFHITLTIEKTCQLVGDIKIKIRK